MFTPQEKENALKVYEEVKSVRAVIQRLGYPTRQTFYQWLREKNNSVRKNCSSHYVAEMQAALKEVFGPMFEAMLNRNRGAA